MSKPTKAFILAAGKGTRMRPLTETTPKPLVRIAGKPLLTHIADKLEAEGVRDIVVNAHHLPGQIIDWAKTRTSQNISVIVEETLLDTGGGVKNALNHFDDEPFYVIAGDSFWLDPPGTTVLQTLAENWNDETMDILAILENTKTMELTTGIGDYDLLENGHVRRSLDKTGHAMFTNIRINHPRLFETAPDGIFSFLSLMDKAERENRFYGLINPGTWHHISTLEDMERVNKHIQA